MKKKALSLLLALCMLLSLLPTTAFATSYTGKTYYNGSDTGATNLNDVTAGTEIGTANGTAVYYLSADKEFDGTASDIDSNGLKIKDYATVVIYLNGYTLTAKGEDAADGTKGVNGDNGSGNSNKTAKTNDNVVCGTTGGCAGILLPEHATLIFVGTGTVVATGGKAGDGSNGGKGGDGYAVLSGSLDLSDVSSGGGGAAGGGAGAGAGAGIGTNGTAAVKYGETADAPATAGTLLVYGDAADSVTLTLSSSAPDATYSAGGVGSPVDASLYELLTGTLLDGCSAGYGGGGGWGGHGGKGAGYGSGGYGGVSGQCGTSGSSSNSNASSDNGTTGDNGSNGFNATDTMVKTPTTYILKGMTVESKFSDLHNDSTKNDAINTLLAAPANLSVWAYYCKSDAAFDENAALRGDYDTDANWQCWKLEDLGYDATSAPNAEHRYNVAVTDVSATGDEPAKKQITVTYNTIDNDSMPASAITASTTVNLLDQYAKDKNGTGSKVGGGDAVKFNDESGFVKYSVDTTHIFAAGFKRVQYVNKNWKFDNTTLTENLGTLNTDGRTANKTYTVQYKPYNMYLDESASTNGHYGTMTANDQYVFGAANEFKTYAALKEFNFRNAGLYTITERVTRNDDQYAATDSKTFDKVYYVVIEQADLEISNAIDTVTHNTTVQDHTFDREVIGQNGEKVQGQYTFASNSATSTQNTYCFGENWADANAQNQSANKNTPDITKIVWEFNVKHTYNTTDISNLEENGPGNRNMNNYLDQNDGTMLSKFKGNDKTVGGTAIDGTTLKADRNTFYSGNNGELHYAENGVAVLNGNDANNALTVQAKYEKDQKITASGAGSDNAKTAWESLDSSDNVTGSITSIFAEDVAFGAKFSNPNFGFRVNKGDFVSGDAFGGTPVTTIPGTITVASGANDLFGKLVSDKQYKGDYYVVTVKDSSGNLVKTWDYNDIDDPTPITANAPVGSEYELIEANGWDAFEAGTYTVTVDYIGLYYQNNTGTDGRKADWNGTESFNWVNASKSFTLTIEPRNIAYKPMNDLYKVYDGTDLLVKDTMSDGDVTSAFKYIIDLTNGSYTAGQFAKGLSNTVDGDYTTGTNNDDAMFNYLQPTDGDKYTSTYHTNLKLELAGTYAQSGKAAGSQNVTVSAARLLDTADDQNYNLVNVNNQALTGEVFVAQMYVTHKMTAAVTVRDTTPMRDVLNLHAKAYMPSGRTMSYGTDGYLASAVTFTKQELVDKNDVTKTTSVYPTSSDTSYDYDATYELVLNSNSEAYIAHVNVNGYTANIDGFKIDGNTGAVEQVAKLTSNNNDPTRFLKVTMTLKDFGNYVVVKQTENTAQYPIATFGQCKESDTRNGNRNTTVYSNYYAVKDSVLYGTTGASNAETLSHTILYYMAGNGDTFNLILPINQLNNRPVNSTFDNKTGTEQDITVGTEKYQYVTVYENGDSAEFTFTVPQDSYLEDVKIVALGTNDSVPAFENIVTTKPVGKFSNNTNGKISTTYGSKKCELTLELVGVNGVSDLATTTSLYFNNDVATDAGYSAYKLADANEQIGGSTYTFRFTTGESEMGTECKLVIVPVIKKFSPILEKTPYASNVSVEKKVTSPTDSTLTYTGAADDHVYVNYKTLWDTTAVDSTKTYGTINMSYTAAGASSATTLTQQELGANLKDQYNSFGINTEAEGNTSFFDPAKLIPGTVVSVTLKVWRNGVTAALQNDSAAANDNDAMDSVTEFTWTVSPEDYYRLFKDDVVIFRSSNKMEANADLATKQEWENILGYGMDAGNAFNSIATYVTNHKVSMTVADAAWSTQSNFNILTTYADTWYLCGGTRRVIDATEKTMSGLAKGDNLYPTYEYAKLVRDTVTNGYSVETDLGYARVIFGQINLNNAFVYTNSASIGVAPYSTSYTGATVTAYTDTNDLYWFDGWYKNDAGTALDGVAVNGTITDDGSTPTYTIKEHVNYVTFKDGSRVIGYGILDTDKTTVATTLDFAAVPFFTAVKPAIGTENSTAVKNMTFTGTSPYTKSGYTLNGWYKNSVTEANKVANVASVDVAPDNTFYLKSTYNAPIGGGGAAVTTTTVTSTMPMLRKGNTGDAVKTLQTKLNALGYNCGAVDGVFGNDTYNAVVKYQKAMGITVDGVVGKGTWGKLGVTGTTVTVAATTAVTSTTTTSATSNMPMLRKGNTGDAVKTLQTKLNALGYNCGAVDGVFGTNTYNAVVKFQKDKGLSVDGVVGNQTWAKLG